MPLPNNSFNQIQPLTNSVFIQEDKVKGGGEFVTFVLQLNNGGYFITTSSTLFALAGH